MNRQKRNNYALNGSFHTLEIKSQEVTPTKEKPVSNCITTRINQDGTIATSKINPNKLVYCIIDI